MSGLDRIGIELDELNRLLLSRMLRGEEWPVIVAALTTEYDPDAVAAQMDDLVGHYERLKKNRILRPLFSP